MATIDEQMAERRAAAAAAKKKHPDPSTFDAELVTLHGKKITVTDEEFAMMLEKAGGFRTRVAKQLGITSSAVTHRIKRSKYLTEVCKTVEETVVDIAEAQLVAAAQRGEPWAVTFILKCKGRKRGWIEKQDVVFGADGDAAPPPIVLPVHDPAFIEAERARQKREFAEIVDAAVVELAPEKAANRGGNGETWAPLGPSSPPGSGEGASVAPSGGEEAQEARPSESEASREGPTAEAAKRPQGAQEQKPAPPPPQPRVPRTPSEAAAMRREQEARERAANGGERPQQTGPTAFRAVPVTFPRR